MTTYNTYPRLYKNIIDGITLKALLLTDAASYDYTDEFVSDLSNEVSGGGYARQSMPGTVSYDASGAYFTPSANITFENITASVGHVIFFDDTGNDATSRLVGAVELNSTVNVVADDFPVAFTGAAFRIL